MRSVKYDVRESKIYKRRESKVRCKKEKIYKRVKNMPENVRESKAVCSHEKTRPKPPKHKNRETKEVNMTPFHRRNKKKKKKLVRNSKRSLESIGYNSGFYRFLLIRFRGSYYIS